MRYKPILEMLEKYNEDEKLFKEFYYMEKNPLNIQKFKEKYKHQEEDINTVLAPNKLPSNRRENDFIKKGNNISVIKHPRYVPFYLHDHAYFEMIYVVKGECIHQLENNKSTLKAGDICILAPNVKHGIKVFDDSIIINILIRQSTFLDIFMNYMRDKSQIGIFFLDNIYTKKKINYIIFHTGKDEKILESILDLYIENMNDDEYTDRIMCSILTIFFAKLTRYYKDSIELPEVRYKKSNYENQIIRYVYENYQNMTLDKLSKHFHYSLPYCSKLIKEITGFSFSKLLTQIKLQNGKNYLLNTQLSVESISEIIGYKNPETFIRVFKRYYDCSPSQYRKNQI